MNKLILTSLLALFSFNLEAKEIKKNTAKFQAIDKITGVVDVIEIPVNGQKQFEEFSIVVRACKTNPPEETPENYAFVDIAETIEEETQNIYKGWMISSSPALNPVEHSMYDIWLLECIDTEIPEESLLSIEALAQRDEIKKAPKNNKEYKSKFKKQTKKEKLEEVEETVVEKPLEFKEVIEEEVVEPVVVPLSEFDENSPKSIIAPIVTGQPQAIEPTELQMPNTPENFESQTNEDTQENSGQLIDFSNFNID